jgi:hypothetical protein
MNTVNNPHTQQSGLYTWIQVCLKIVLNVTLFVTHEMLNKDEPYCHLQRAQVWQM